MVGKGPGPINHEASQRKIVSGRIAGVEADHLRGELVSNPEPRVIGIVPRVARRVANQAVEEANQARQSGPTRSQRVDIAPTSVAQAVSPAPQCMGITACSPLLCRSQPA